MIEMYASVGVRIAHSDGADEFLYASDVWYAFAEGVPQISQSSRRPCRF